VTLRIKLEADGKDDAGFTSVVQRLVDGILRTVVPTEFYIVKIDNWFGVRWYCFAHKMLGALGVHSYDLRVPPFVPHRVVSQRYWIREAGAAPEYRRMRAPLSLHVDQPSAENRSRRVDALCPDAALIWWSGNTRANGRGSVMAYLPAPHGHVGWYAGARRVARDWRFADVKNTSHAELESLAAESAMPG
jgi:hypothetical protein